MYCKLKYVVIYLKFCKRIYHQFEHQIFQFFHLGFYQSLVFFLHQYLLEINYDFSCLDYFQIITRFMIWFMIRIMIRLNIQKVYWSFFFGGCFVSFPFSLNFFVQWLILSFELLFQAQVHFFLLLPPLFLVHVRCLILLYIVFFNYLFFFVI